MRSVSSPDDADRAAAVEALLDPEHPLLLGVPVEQAGVEDELRVLLERHARLGRRSLGRVLDDRPANVERPRPPACGLAGLLEQLAPLGVELGARVDVLGRADRQPGVLVVDLVALDRRQLAEQLERRLERPVEVGAEAVGPPVDPRQVVGAAAGDRARDLLDERPRERRRAHRHLPAGLRRRGSG